MTCETPAAVAQFLFGFGITGLGRENFFRLPHGFGPAAQQQESLPGQAHQPIALLEPTCQKALHASEEPQHDEDQRAPNISSQFPR